jgi:hypothetical protein
MVLLGDEAQVEARSSTFGDSANLDARLVHFYAEHTIGSKIILDTPMELLCDVAHVKYHFSLFGDGVSVSAI